MFENRNLKHEIKILSEIVSSQAEQIKELSERLDSRAYNDMVDRYKVKEKRMFKKAVEIIMSGEKPIEECNYEIPVTRTIKYKNFWFYQDRRCLMATYKNFTFNEENSNLLYDLYKSLNWKGIK